METFYIILKVSLLLLIILLPLKKRKKKSGKQTQSLSNFAVGGSGYIIKLFFITTFIAITFDVVAANKDFRDHRPAYVIGKKGYIPVTRYFYNRNAGRTITRINN